MGEDQGAEVQRGSRIRTVDQSCTHAIASPQDHVGGRSKSRQRPDAEVLGRAAESGGEQRRRKSVGGFKALAADRGTRPPAASRAWTSSDPLSGGRRAPTLGRRRFPRPARPELRKLCQDVRQLSAELREPFSDRRTA